MMTQAPEELSYCMTLFNVLDVVFLLINKHYNHFKNYSILIALFLIACVVSDTWATNWIETKQWSRSNLVQRKSLVHNATPS